MQFLGPNTTMGYSGFMAREVEKKEGGGRGLIAPKQQK